MEWEAAYRDYKPLLFSIAYRMLGSVADAEDMVQEAFLAAHTTDRAKGAGHVDNWKAYLCKTVTNRCIDRLKSARAKREQYVGPWLPEPIVQKELPPRTAYADPVQLTLLEETVSYAFLVLLERLNPVERAVLILREAFDYSYGDIAGIVGKTELGCRQIYSRVRRKVQAQPAAVRGPLESVEHERLVKRFLEAAATGNVQGLLTLLAEDITLVSDGGGKALAALRPILGRERVAAFLFGLAAKLDPPAPARLVRVGGEAALLIETEEAPTIVCFDIQADGRCGGIFLVRNPDKLTTLRL